MEKRKCLTFLFCLMLCFFLFQYAARAQSSSHSISSQGNITYSPLNENLAVIPDGWNLKYGSGKQIIFLDSVVEHTPGKPSIRLEPHTSADVNTWREVDGHWFNVKPGDRIVAKIWIKTSASGLGDTNTWSGGRLGMDIYAHTSVGYGIVGGWGSPQEMTGYPNVIPRNVVWGKDWTLVQWDITVPNTFFTTVRISQDWSKPEDSCNPVQIDSFVLWLDARAVNDTGLVWFADAELYINPK